MRMRKYKDSSRILLFETLPGPIEVLSSELQNGLNGDFEFGSDPDPISKRPAFRCGVLMWESLCYPLI